MKRLMIIALIIVASTPLSIVQSTPELQDISIIVSNIESKFTGSIQIGFSLDNQTEQAHKYQKEITSIDHIQSYRLDQEENILDWEVWITYNESRIFDVKGIIDTGNATAEYTRTYYDPDYLFIDPEGAPVISFELANIIASCWISTNQDILLK